MNRKPLGLGIMYGFLAAVGILFLVATPIVTRSAPEGQGWWTQPYFMPIISLLLVAVLTTYDGYPMTKRGAGGDVSIFVTRPISLGLIIMILTVSAFAWSGYQQQKHRSANA